MIILYRGSLLAFGFLLAGCAHVTADSPPRSTSAEWLFTEPVHYLENHDPAMVWLQDGRQLQVVYGENGWEQVELWPTGRPLLLTYSEPTGVVLIDPASGVQFPVLAGCEDRHPLDLLLQSRRERAFSTLEIIAAYDTVYEHWAREIDRLIMVIVAAEQVPASVRRDLRKAQQAWSIFRDQQFAAAGQIYNLTDGTLGSIEFAQHRLGVIKARALHLSELVDPAQLARARPHKAPEAHGLSTKGCRCMNLQLGRLPWREVGLGVGCGPAGR